MLEVSFSDAARVARPNEVQRYTAVSATAATMTMPAMMKRSIGTTAPSILTTFWGRICGSSCGSVPNASSIDAWNTSSTPSEATSFASGGELRNGRKMPSSAAAATSAMNTSAMISAGALPTVKPNSSVLSAQNA